MLVESQRRLIGGIGLVFVGLMLPGCWSKVEEQPKQRKADFRIAPPPGMSKGEVDPDTPETNQTLDFTGLRGVLAGKWAKKTDPYHRLEFTAKSIEQLIGGYGRPPDVGKYDLSNDLLTLTDNQGRHNVYGLEFLSDGEIALRPERQTKPKGFFDSSSFDGLEGRWRRISLPTGHAANEKSSGPVADAKRQVQKIEQKLAKLEAIHKAALVDRDELAVKLRSVGVNSPADLKNNVRGMRLAENAVKLATEIEGLERQLAVIDTELLKAKSIVRRMEAEQAGLSADELRKLTVQLREAEERTDGMPLPVTPFDVEAAVEKTLKATPRSPKTSEIVQPESTVLVDKWETKVGSRRIYLDFAKGKSVTLQQSPTQHVGVYELKKNLLILTDRDGDAASYRVESISAKELVLRPETASSVSYFRNLEGRWTKK